METGDLIDIVLACVIGYSACILTFYFLSKLLFPKIEVDEEYEKLIENYQKIRKKAKERVVSRQIKPHYFKLSRSIKNRVNYVEGV